MHIPNQEWCPEMINSEASSMEIGSCVIINDRNLLAGGE